ncbi:MAG TPA: type II toxin-antitoxin system VapC family toxin [Candidatus Binatia bacterium]|nr:type II toxin-antitoxin system VapC family toxin [Candidatus Binatia bacterium]
MILVDANILLYAYDRSSPRHEPARRWLEAALNGEETVGFPLLTLLAFLRISTHPAVFRRPMEPGRAIEIVATWLARPNAAVVAPSERHWQILADVARAGQARGPLLMDAHLAALAIEHGATLATTDRGFGRFRGLRFRDPLEAPARRGG